MGMCGKPCSRDSHSRAITASRSANPMRASREMPEAVKRRGLRNAAGLSIASASQATIAPQSRSRERTCRAWAELRDVVLLAGDHLPLLRRRLVVVPEGME